MYPGRGELLVYSLYPTKIFPVSQPSENRLDNNVHRLGFG
jgi:hypothetical protein